MRDNSAGGGANGPAYDYPSNVLWIEIFDVTNDFASLTLHNTRSNYFYQLLSKLDLNEPWWTFRQIVQDTAGTNQVFFDPVSTFGRPTEFFRGVEGDVVLSIQITADAIEPNPTSHSGGQTGLFYITANVPVNRDLTVVYRLSGSASNGSDYTNLTGTVIIPENEQIVYIGVAPYEDTKVEFEESAIATLVLTNGYLVDPDLSSATVWISDNYGTNFFTVVVTNLDNPVGLDYHPPTKSLLMSVQYPHGFTNNFALVNSNGVVTTWTGVSNLIEEIKLATVKTTANGFTEGEVFFGTGPNGIVGKISADGTVVDLNWTSLTTNQMGSDALLRGSLYVDQTGVFSNDLIVVTGGDPDSGGAVWRINSLYTNQVANLTNQVHPHLEGVITLTNDTSIWGPWAAKIITGAESKTPPLIHTIDTNGSVASFDFGIAPEDFDIIQTNQDLYCVGYRGDDSVIFKLSRTLLTNYVGNLLITQAGEFGFPPKLFITQWDNTITNFVIRRITLPASFGAAFEHVTFAPINIPSL